MISETQTHAGGSAPVSSPWQQASPGGGQLPSGTITFAFQPEEFLLPEEDKTEFVRLGTAMWANLAPSGMLECTIAARIICVSWRLQRAGRYDQYIVEAAKKGRAEPKKKGPGRPPKAAQLTDGEAIAYLVMQTRVYATIGGYEGHLARCLHRDLNLYFDLQRTRVGQTAHQAHLLSGQRP